MNPLQPVGSTPRAAEATDTAAIAQQFEALFIGQMLHAARAASLAEDPLSGNGGATYTDMIDQARAQLFARTAPLGVARLLAR